MDWVYYLSFWADYFSWGVFASIRLRFKKSVASRHCSRVRHSPVSRWLAFTNLLRITGGETGGN